MSQATAPTSSRIARELLAIAEEIRQSKKHPQDGPQLARADALLVEAWDAGLFRFDKPMQYAFARAKQAIREFPDAEDGEYEHVSACLIFWVPIHRPGFSSNNLHESCWDGLGWSMEREWWAIGIEEIAKSLGNKPELNYNDERVANHIRANPGQSSQQIGGALGMTGPAVRKIMERKLRDGWGFYCDGKEHHPPR